jgi:hypothetical protein
MVRIANRRILPNMYTSYAIPDFNYAKYIKDGGSNMVGRGPVW